MPHWPFDVELYLDIAEVRGIRSALMHFKYIYININILIHTHLIETSNFENSGGHTPSPISEIMLTKRAFRPRESWSSSG